MKLCLLLTNNHKITMTLTWIVKVSKGAKIRNRYNQVPHLTQDTNGKVTNSQFDTTNESQEVSPFPAGDHNAHINRRAPMHSKHRTEKNIKDPQKKYRLGTVRKIFYWRALTGFTVPGIYKPHPMRRQLYYTKVLELDQYS